MQNNEMIALPQMTAPWKAGKYYGLEAFSLIIELSFLYRNEDGRNERFEEYVRNGLFMQGFYAYEKLGSYSPLLNSMRSKSSNRQTQQKYYLMFLMFLL